VKLKKTGVSRESFYTVRVGMIHESLGIGVKYHFEPSVFDSVGVLLSSSVYGLFCAAFPGYITTVYEGRALVYLCCCWFFLLCTPNEHHI